MVLEGISTRMASSTTVTVRRREVRILGDRDAGAVNIRRKACARTQSAQALVPPGHRVVEHLNNCGQKQQDLEEGKGRIA